MILRCTKKAQTKYFDKNFINKKKNLVHCEEDENKIININSKHIYNFV